MLHLKKIVKTFVYKDCYFAYTFCVCILNAIRFLICYTIFKEKNHMKVKNNYDECLTNLPCSIRKYFDLDYKHKPLQ